MFQDTLLPCHFDSVSFLPFVLSFRGLVSAIYNMTCMQRMTKVRRVIQVEIEFDDKDG